MTYTVRPKTRGRFGSFRVIVGDARQALDIAQYLVKRGVIDAEIVGYDDIAFDFVEPEHVASESERA